MNNLDKVNHGSKTLVDEVEEKLLDYFRSNKMQLGSALPKEKELANSLGVGRSVLREALSRLRMMGLIETRTKRGMVLKEPFIFGGLQRILDPEVLGDETLINLLGFRVALELGICSSIVENLTEKDIEDLENIVKNGVVYENNMYMPVSERHFHSKLYEITGNKMIMQFQEIIYPVTLFVKNKFSDFFEPINKELKQNDQIINHQDLLDLLKKRDKEGFREAMERHFIPYRRFIQNN
jgi:DNA-binding FadR family transcriptional regulator